MDTHTKVRANMAGDIKANEIMVGRLTGEAEALESVGRQAEADDKRREAGWIQAELDGLRKSQQFA